MTRRDEQDIAMDNQTFHMPSSLSSDDEMTANRQILPYYNPVIRYRLLTYRPMPLI